MKAFKFWRPLKFRWPGILFAILILWLGAPPGAQAQTADGVKAAFLFNFAKFVEWPAGAFADNNAPVTIGFVGDTPVEATFEAAVKGKNVNGRDLAIKHLAGATGAEACQIVFIADGSQTGAVVTALKGKPVLIAGEPDGLLEAGGMILFATDNGRVVFDLNLSTAAAAGLKVNPKLQKVARNVKGG